MLHDYQSVEITFQKSSVHMTLWTNFRATAKSHKDGVHFDPKSLAIATKVSLIGHVFPQIIYRVTHLVANLGWVDFDL